MSATERNRPPEHHPTRDASAGRRYTRWAAAAVLVPTVPMLLLSVAALAVFYAAPTRFGRLLAQLPGEEVIRSMLVFAPATLLGIVILASLYALERPETPVPRPVQTPSRPQRSRLGITATWLLPPVGLLFIASVGARLMAFVSPGRWQALLAPLPGDRFLAPVFEFAPWALLALLVALAVMALRARAAKPGYAPDQRQAARIGAVATLIAALPMLGLSLTALAIFAAAPDRFARLLARLTQEAFIRLGLVFTPAALLSLVLLALLVLFFSAMGRGLDRSSAQPGRGPAKPWRQTLAVWVLTAGLAFSAIIGLGLGAVAIYLVVR